MGTAKKTKEHHTEEYKAPVKRKATKSCKVPADTHQQVSLLAALLRTDIPGAIDWLLAQDSPLLATVRRSVAEAGPQRKES